MLRRLWHIVHVSYRKRTIFLHIYLLKKEQDRYSLPDKWKFTSSVMLRYVNEKSGKLCTVACVPVGKQVVIHGKQVAICRGKQAVLQL